MLVASSPTPPIPPLEFVNGLPMGYECPVCSQALRYPVQFDECNHHCCSSCLTQVIRSAARCPICHKPIHRDRVFVDKQLQKSVQALRVYCPVSQNKCGWVSQFGELQAHLAECEFTTVKCPKGCGVNLQRRFTDRHIRDDCTKRDIQCEYCLQQVKHELLDDHLESCESYPLDCPNACSNKDIPRIKLQAHLEKCPRAGAACPFTEFGCEHKTERKNLHKHIKEEPTRHLALICEGVVDLKRMLLTMKDNAERFGRSMGDLGKKTESLEKLYGPQMLWKITDYDSKCRAAKNGTNTTIFSPVFFTGRHGYRMALSACLFGDGQAKGKYMSVFICICQGDFDALLTWPFDHKITITLLDQTEDPTTRKNISYDIKPGSGNKAFLQRPVAERNSSFGAQKFIDLGTVNNPDNCYVGDDTIFIKVQVDTEHMTPL